MQGGPILIHKAHTYRSLPLPTVLSDPAVSPGSIPSSKFPPTFSFSLRSQLGFETRLDRGNSQEGASAASKI